MTDKVLTILKIGVAVLFVAALGMGGWLLYTKVFKSDKEVEEPEDQSVELIWWTLWEEQEDLQVLADAYHQQNPNVTIKIEPQEVTSQYRERLLERLSDSDTSNDPDIMRIHNTWTPLFQEYLFSLPSSVMTETEYASTFYDTALVDFIGDDGDIYGIPLMFDAIGVYYNKDILSDQGYSTPEENWDDFLIQAKALTQYKEDGSINIAGAGLGTADNVDFSFDIVSLLMLQEGASIVGSSGSTNFATDEDMKAAKALKFYTEFATRHDVWDRTLSRDITMFAEGRLAMMFAPSWRVFDVNDALDSVGATLDYDIAPVPQQPTVTDEEINWATYWGEAVSGNSENSDIAWDFLKFASEQDQLETFYNKCKETREFGEIYPRKDMTEDLISDKYVGAYIKMADTAISWKMVDKENVADEFDALIKEIVTSGGMSTSTIQGRLEEVADTIDQIIATD